MSAGDLIRSGRIGTAAAALLVVAAWAAPASAQDSSDPVSGEPAPANEAGTAAIGFEPAAPAIPAGRRDSQGCAYAGNQFGEIPIRRLERAIVCVVNRVRVRRRLAAVRPVRSLGRAATRHARDMARHDYFRHRSPAGSFPADRALRAGYIRGRSWILGEVLAWGTLEETTPAEVVRSWMASPAHRAVLVQRRFRDIGVGVSAGLPLRGSPGGATFVAELARR